MSIVQDIKGAYADILERAATTFLQAFAGVLIIGGEEGTADKAAIAGVAALLSLVKSVIATKVGNKGTASLTTSV